MPGVIVFASVDLLPLGGKGRGQVVPSDLARANHANGPRPRPEPVGLARAVDRIRCDDRPLITASYMVSAHTCEAGATPVPNQGTDPSIHSQHELDRSWRRLTPDPKILDYRTPVATLDHECCADGLNSRRAFRPDAPIAVKCGAR